MALTCPPHAASTSVTDKRGRWRYAATRRGRTRSKRSSSPSGVVVSFKFNLAYFYIFFEGVNVSSFVCTMTCPEEDMEFN